MPNSSRMRIRKLRIATLLSIVVLLSSGMALAQSETTALTWQRWETTITAGFDYVGGQNGPGNPYRDMILRVRFSAPGRSDFIQDAFWTGNMTGATKFKVRAMLPTAIGLNAKWTWKVESCAGTSNNKNCATDTILLQATGTIKVTTPGSNPELYRCGPLTQMFLTVMLPNGSQRSMFTDLELGSCGTFRWFADTAWTAPPREISVWNSQSGAEWGRYLDNRKSKGFNVVMVAPAVAWQPQGTDDWPALPHAPGFSFLQSGSCDLPIPNNCSRPNPDYWDKFDTMIKTANDKGLIVSIVGVLDPVGLGMNGTFPNQPHVVDFARYLAARVAGNHVVLSPGFDTWATDRTKDGTLIENVMNATGNAMKAARPHQLMTNHLAGKSPCTDYRRFQGSNWVSFHLYQSGHAKGGALGDPQIACPGKLAGESSQRAALRRAREMPLTLRGYTNHGMPVINGEALYDDHPRTAEPDTRYRVRQSGYVSILSGSKGFTYGASRIWQWFGVGNPIYNLNSARDMQHLISRFKSRPFFIPRHELILNQPAEHEKKMVLASDGVSTIVAYLPGGVSQIQMNPASFANLNCDATWAKNWYNPATNTLVIGGSCSFASGALTLTRPPCQGTNADCDFVLEITKSTSLLSTSDPALQGLRVWADLSPEDGSSAIHGQLGDGEPFVISSSGAAFQQSPQVTSLADGYLVVWHAENLDGDRLGIFGQLVDAGGNLVLGRFQINEQSAHDQRDPVVASDPAGNAVVVWSSLSQDGGKSVVIGRRFDRSGAPQGNEFVIDSTASGHQATPLVTWDDAGGFIVAWSTPAGKEINSAISFQRFDASARPLGEPVQVKSESGEEMRPTAIQSSGGIVKLSWLSEATDGGIRFDQRWFETK
jgi:Protein of unknown function (DUF4038)/Domain of unknown function (DUF5060)